MPGGTTQTTNQNQQSQPWKPAIPGLENLIGQISGGGGTLTGPQSSAIANLQGEAGGVPSFGAAGTGAINNLFSSSTAPQVGMLGDAYNSFQAANSPYLNSNYTNPYTNPALSSAMSTMNEDITNQVRGNFAAAGRTGSPDEVKTLSRGLAQGEGGLLTNEYNTLVGQQQNANTAGLGAGKSTAQGQAGLNQIPLQNAMMGIQGAGAVPGLWTMPGATQLTAANVGQQQPYQNLQLPASMLTGIAGLGGQNTGTSTTTQPTNPWTTALAGGLGLASLSGNSLGGSALGGLWKALPFGAAA